MAERPRLRCQDVERRFPLLGGWRHQTPEACYNRQQECDSSHEVQDTVDFKACHQTRTDQRAEYRTDPAHQNEPSAYRDDAIGWHAIVRVRDTHWVQR